MGTVAVAVAACATLGVLLATPMPSWVRAALAAAVCIDTLAALRRVAHRAGRGVRTIRIDGSGRIDVCEVGGRLRQGCLCDGSFVAPWLTIVRWRPQGARFDRTVMILPDALAGEDFRRLRVVLRWGGGR